jgi:MarR family transcriptional regulator, organic hydroperoxide resistance regulator
MSTVRVKPPSQKSPLSTGLGYLIRRTHKSFSRLLAIELADRGINFKQYFYLRALLEEDDISQTELGERVGMHRATVTTVLETLESNGYVRRLADPNDARSRRVLLTLKGQRLREPLLATIETIQSVAGAGISAADLLVFRRVCEHMTHNLDRACETSPR